MSHAGPFKRLVHPIKTVTTEAVVASFGPKRAQNVTGLPHITKTIDANNNSKEATTATASSKGMSGAVVVLL